MIVIRSTVTLLRSQSNSTKIFRGCGTLASVILASYKHVMLNYGRHPVTLSVLSIFHTQSCLLQATLCAPDQAGLLHILLREPQDKTVAAPAPSRSTADDSTRKVDARSFQNCKPAAGIRCAVRPLDEGVELL